jgi:hypothetical protein
MVNRTTTVVASIFELADGILHSRKGSALVKYVTTFLVKCLPIFEVPQHGCGDSLPPGVETKTIRSNRLWLFPKILKCLGIRVVPGKDNLSAASVEIETEREMNIEP